MIALSLPQNFDRQAAIEFVGSHSNWTAGPDSPIRGGRKEAMSKLAGINAPRYAKTRNHLDGAVSQLSPYIRHGIVSSNEVRNHVVERFPKSTSERFLQQLAWRDYWQRHYHQHPDWIWNSVESYKTGFGPDDYSDELPSDIANGQTGVSAIDHFINGLLETGWLHNHARLYLASYICHWRRVKWQVGARWMMAHLLDGDPASNNLSWQWVASTFANKPYYFNLDNIRKYSAEGLDTTTENNGPLEGSYEALHNRLFPNLEPR